MTRPELQYGSRGGAVRALQQLVSQAEHARPGLARDGIFGPLTQAAVLRFQRSRQLPADGVVGRHTWAALGHKLNLPELAASAPPKISLAASTTSHPAGPQPAQRQTAVPQPTVPRPPVSAARTAPVAYPAPATRPAPASPAVAPRAAPATPTRADQPGTIDEPRWFQVALAEFDAHHTVFGTTDGNRRIHEYFLATAYHPKIGTTEAWCSAFANWCMRQAGLVGTNSAAAASWLKWGVELKEPRHGCIMVIHWAGKHSGSGNHVTFFDKEAGGLVYYFGGNQTTAHRISEGHASHRAFATVHYRWPGA